MFFKTYHKLATAKLMLFFKTIRKIIFIFFSLSQHILQNENDAKLFQKNVSVIKNIGN